MRLNPVDTCRGYKELDLTNNGGLQVFSNFGEISITVWHQLKLSCGNCFLLVHSFLAIQFPTHISAATFLCLLCSSRWDQLIEIPGTPLCLAGRSPSINFLIQSVFFRRGKILEHFLKLFQVTQCFSFAKISFLESLARLNLIWNSYSGDFFSGTKLFLTFGSSSQKSQVESKT